MRPSVGNWQGPKLMRGFSFSIPPPCQSNLSCNITGARLLTTRSHNTRLHLLEVANDNMPRTETDIRLLVPASEPRLNSPHPPALMFPEAAPAQILQSVPLRCEALEDANFKEQRGDMVEGNVGQRQAVSGSVRQSQAY